MGYSPRKDRTFTNQGYLDDKKANITEVIVESYKFQKKDTSSDDKVFFSPREPRSRDDTSYPELGSGRKQMFN